jgi:hypothetical protein
MAIRRERIPSKIKSLEKEYEKVEKNNPKAVLRLAGIVSLVERLQRRFIG